MLNLADQLCVRSAVCDMCVVWDMCDVCSGLSLSSLWNSEIVKYYDGLIKNCFDQYIRQSYLHKIIFSLDAI